jgi:hypothetical protein
LRDYRKQRRFQQLSNTVSACDISAYNAGMRLAWCWRWKKDVPMIDEAEWQALWTGTADNATAHRVSKGEVFL